jgi:hypothetical protein
MSFFADIIKTLLFKRKISPFGLYLMNKASLVCRITVLFGNFGNFISQNISSLHEKEQPAVNKSSFDKTLHPKYTIDFHKHTNHCISYRKNANTEYSD